MKKKILIIQGSSLKKINIKTDTSFFLGLEAQRRSYQIYYYEPKDLSFINGKVTALCSKVKFVDNPKQPIKVLNKTVLNLLQAKLILIRSEPPFNQQYINTTFILEHISKKVRIINHPKALREVPEKLFSLRLTKYMPQTLISENLNEIKTFLKRSSDIFMPGGRLVCISYHSLEDRLVKRYIQNGSFNEQVESDIYGNKNTYFKKIGKIVTPSEDELNKNKRSRSAKLRIAEKI